MRFDRLSGLPAAQLQVVSSLRRLKRALSSDGRGETITGYQAAAGWNPVTGGGSPNAPVLIPLLVRYGL